MLREISETKLNEVLRLHDMFLENKKGGKRADLSSADLRGANLRDARLSGADLSGADLSDANLSDARLNGAHMSDANLCGANLSDANLCGANLGNADLSDADLSDANLCNANLNGAKGMLSAIDFMNKNFEKTQEGYIAYKTFNCTKTAPSEGELKEGSIISENVDLDRTNNFGCGINVATLEWVKANNKPGAEIWKVLIRNEWLMGVCVPYNSGGKFRCERGELVEIVK